MNRRIFNMTLASAAATSVLGCTTTGGRTDASGRTVLYNAIDEKMTQYDVDVDTATLTPRASVRLPSFVQYASIHPSHRYLYASTSDAGGGSGPDAGKMNRLCALRISADGALTLHGEPLALKSRPIHNSVDSTGRYALTCFSNRANLTIHGINADGTLGAEIAQDANLDRGIFPHQIRTTPGNRSVILVTRGVSSTATAPESPGALKVFKFNDGQLSPLANIQVGGRGGLGYGPRHLDFHPTKPWTYIAVERQNQLHMHVMQGDSPAPDASYIRKTTVGEGPLNHSQLNAAIHVHPQGHVVYVANRARGTVKFNGQDVFDGGENSIAVFSINPNTGEPTLIQSAEAHGFYFRTFSIDPTGRLLVAASGVDMLVREGDTVRRVPAALHVYRIAADGRLTFVRRYDVELPNSAAQQLWVGMMALPV